MSTGTKLDSTASGGIGGIKERLKSLQENIKKQDEKADALTKEKETLHRNYCRTVGKQQNLKDKITSKEEQIEKTEKKLKETESRLIQKEEFLKELATFNKALKTIVPSEGERADKEKELNQHKVIYSQTHERYTHAREQKIDLEQRLEHVEIRNREVQRKVDALKQELEANLMEEGRRAEQCKQSMDSAFKLERNIIGVEKMLEIVMKRKEDASKKVSELQKKITKSEDELEETSYDRRVVEATIREILLKSKEN